MVKKIIKDLKNILQSLCTHSAFFLFHDPIFVISTGLGTGDDWLRKRIFSFVSVKPAETAVDENIYFKIKNSTMGANEGGVCVGFNEKVGAIIDSHMKSG